MKNFWQILFVATLGFVLASCGGLKKSNPEGAIRQAIEAHLAGRTGLANDKIIMDMKKVEIHGNEADAEVVFRSRSDPKANMAFHYRLRNEGNQWKIENGRPGGENALHPPSEAPSEGAPQSAGPLPEGHPKTQPETKPPNHP